MSNFVFTGRVFGFILLCAAILFLGAHTQAQQKKTTLKNPSTVSMVKGGMSESVIISVINQSETQVDLRSRSSEGEQIHIHPAPEKSHDIRP